MTPLPNTAPLGPTRPAAAQPPSSRHLVMVPGIGGSGEHHWQTRWERAAGPSATRIAPSSWDSPRLDDWCDAIDKAVTAARGRPVLVAHSMGVLAVALWAERAGAHAPHRVAGAFLVAAPDSTTRAYPTEAAEFGNPARTALPFPSLLLASDDDPYAPAESSMRRAEEWGAGLVELGPLGHVNGASGLGDWPEGRNLLAAFTAGLR